MIEILDSGKNVKSYAFADKVVGAGAAFLYVKLGVKDLYAGVVSDRAVEILQNNGVCLSYGEKVPSIRNREGNGNCPMETAVQGIRDTDAAIAAIRARLKELTENKK